MAGTSPASRAKEGGGQSGMPKTHPTAPHTRPDDGPRDSPIPQGVPHAEEVRRLRVDALVAEALPKLHADVRQNFGEAEVRALAALFNDLDHSQAGTLTLQEFRLLLTLLAERSKAAASLRGARTVGEEASGNTFPSEARATSSGADVAAPALGLRDALFIFRQLELDASGALSFGELLRLLAADPSIHDHALAEAKSLPGDTPHRQTKTSKKGKKAKHRRHRAEHPLSPTMKSLRAVPTGHAATPMQNQTRIHTAKARTGGASGLV